MTSARPRILFLGLPLGAEVLRRAGADLIGIGLWHLDAPGARRVRNAEIPCWIRPNLRDPNVVRELKALSPDRILSFFWPKKIPPEVLALAPAFGTHPSLLPSLRGPDPYYWAIRKGHSRTGVTLHALEAEYDTGAVLARTSLAISPSETAWSLAKRLDPIALRMLSWAALCPRLPPGLAQRAFSEATSNAPRPREEDLELDFKKSAVQISAEVRAAAPYPGAGAIIGSGFLEIIRVDDRPQPESVRGLRPGEAFFHEDAWHIQCGKGVVVVCEARGEDGVKLAGNVLAEELHKRLRSENCKNPAKGSEKSEASWGETR